ncbi:MAG: hypothetical protein PPP56_00745 [Longimonas sp.]|uniref:hypothetical protein n=1 Tax=Longimonas sp. TaxID=2039626 RepID=UPI00335778E8
MEELMGCAHPAHIGQMSRIRSAPNHRTPSRGMEPGLSARKPTIDSLTGMEPRMLSTT